MRKTLILAMSSLGMFLAVGCASDRHDAIPQSARLVAEDQGKIDFVAPSDGEVFLEDRTANKLVYSGKMNEGERLSVDAIKNRVLVDGRTVQDQKIRDLDNLRVFFRGEPRADVAGSRTVGTRTVETTHYDTNGGPSHGSDIIVQPRNGDSSDAVRVHTNGDANSKVTVEPREDGSKVTVEPRDNR
jgi:hypothetical protein